MNSDYCIATLSCGEKYNTFLRDNLLSNKSLASEPTEIFVTTDDEEGFASYKDRVKTFNFNPEWRIDTRRGRSRLWFNYHLKRHAIRNALKAGYTKILYVDSDIEILTWDKDFLIKKDRGFWFRTFLNKNQYMDKYNFYSEAFGANLWHYYRPVSEKLIYINSEPDKINGFLNTWEHLDIMSKDKVNPYSEGYEILMACRFNGAVVNKYRPDPFKGDRKMMTDTHIK
tara:strand:+ start:344 stop:1024 length:681 start_codon:yes stop_codon:yes gene_type:complete